MSNSKHWKKELSLKLKNYLNEYTACHDFYHHLRTQKNALKIAKNIKCDKDVVYAGALLHDVGYKNHEQDAKNHPVYGMKLAKKWLNEVGFPKDKIAEVLETIRLHDNFSWGHDHEPTDHVETKIIQDADRIEAIGAIGVARFSYWFGEMGFPIFNPASVPNTKEVWLDHSLLDQLRRDGIKKWENLNFSISRKISKKRANFMLKFYKELDKEIKEN